MSCNEPTVDCPIATIDGSWTYEINADSEPRITSVRFELETGCTPIYTSNPYATEDHIYDTKSAIPYRDVTTNKNTESKYNLEVIY
ncbi:hypothetical protein F8203_gp086 [Heliothis virescens ascovirus 3f]|uniref:Uncharacterized protein n=1 Tax=Heliothis virescens ascovirus 3f TaxID=328614 RepID=A0A171PVH7_9VIRU|nr:hypothetical protein F8203_gp086 [Heliothis virescens ascovirus 3f]AJP09052.1 hypothetical protein [Heliothis virescens ascovirus 3f]